MGSILIETRDITKKFGDFTANDKINIAVEEGEIRAIIGENGAGKSTLMNMLYGILKPTSGEILFNGKPVILDSPLDAIKLGIGMVHQHFKLSPSLSIYENIVLGDETVKTLNVFGKHFKGFLVDQKKEMAEIQALVDKFNFNLDITAKVRDISIGAKQRVEILKMLYRNVNLLILDEPTAGQDWQTYTEIMNFLKQLNDQGKTIMIITHDMYLLMEYTNRSLAFADGTLIADTDPIKLLTEKALIKKAALKRTSLYNLAIKYQLENPDSFVRAYIDAERDEKHA